MDSGTTLLRLPQKVFDAVVEAVARTSLVSSRDAEESRGTQVMTACWAASPCTLVVSSEDFEGLFVFF